MNPDQLVVDLTRRLVSAPSITGQESKGLRECREIMEELAFDEIWTDDVGNLIGRMGRSETGGILLDAHIDTVGPGKAEDWTVDPFGGLLRDQKIFGRGASDMKGALAAMLVAAGQLKEEGYEFQTPVTISASILEETTEGLALARILDDVRPELVVIGEATELKPNLGGRGRAEVKVEAFGRSAHSSSPSAGLNALDLMVPALGALRTLKLERDPRVGEALAVVTDLWSEPRPSRSVIPHYAAAVIDRRLLPGEAREEVLEGLRSHLESAGLTAVTDRPEGSGAGQVLISLVNEQVPTYTGKVLEGEKLAPAWVMDPSEPVISQALGALRRTGFDGEPGYYRFCTNGSMSAGLLGYLTIGFGPGEEKRAHVADEWIEVSELERALQGYRALMTALG